MRISRIASRTSFSDSAPRRRSNTLPRRSDRLSNMTADGPIEKRRRRELVGQRGEFPDETQTQARVWWKQAAATLQPESGEMVEPGGIEPLTSTMPL